MHLPLWKGIGVCIKEQIMNPSSSNASYTKPLIQFTSQFHRPHGMYLPTIIAHNKFFKSVFLPE